jgi:hypothetical protein
MNGPTETVALKALQLDEKSRTTVAAFSGRQDFDTYVSALTVASFFDSSPKTVLLARLGDPKARGSLPVRRHHAIEPRR